MLSCTLVHMSEYPTALVHTARGRRNLCERSRREVWCFLEVAGEIYMKSVCCEWEIELICDVILVILV
jgi:hypothetical protein